MPILCVRSEGVNLKQKNVKMKIETRSKNDKLERAEFYTCPKFRICKELKQKNVKMRIETQSKND